MLPSTALGSKPTSVLRFMFPFARFKLYHIGSTTLTQEKLYRRYHRVFFRAKWSEDADTHSALMYRSALLCFDCRSEDADTSSCCNEHLALLCFECSCGTTRTGITQIQHNRVAKIYSLIDCLRYMMEVGWNPHNIPMEKQLHGRRLTLKGEPGRIALHGYMYWSNIVQWADKWYLLPPSTDDRWPLHYQCSWNNDRFQQALVIVSSDRLFSQVSVRFQQVLVPGDC